MKVVKTSTYIFSTDIGVLVSKLQDVEEYSVEDIIHDRSVSQARAIQFMRMAKAAAGQPVAERTMETTYSQISGELPK